MFLKGQATLKKNKTKQVKDLLLIMIYDVIIALYSAFQYLEIYK